MVFCKWLNIQQSANKTIDDRRLVMVGIDKSNRLFILLNAELIRPQIIFVIEDSTSNFIGFQEEFEPHKLMI